MSYYYYCVIINITIINIMIKTELPNRLQRRIGFLNGQNTRNGRFYRPV